MSYRDIQFLCTIDVGILSNLNEINLTELVNGLRGKKFSEVRKWVNQNMDQDTSKVSCIVNYTTTSVNI